MYRYIYIYVYTSLVCSFRAQSHVSDAALVGLHLTNKVLDSPYNSDYLGVAGKARYCNPTTLKQKSRMHQGTSCKQTKIEGEVACKCTF